MNAARRAQQGFTLIEVLVAIVLMAVLSVVSWQGLDSVARLREHFDRDNARDQALLRVLGQIDLDVRRRAPDHVLDGGNLPLSGAAPRLLPAAIELTGGQAAPQLRIVRTPASGAGAWQQVGWWRDGSVLRRAAPPAGDTFPLPEPQQGDVVLEGVSQFSVRAYVPGRGWQPLPAGQAGGAQPATGLEFTLEQGRPGQAPLRYRRVVSLP
ncbi:prepilin-type N-terminal cleavage/methylation domain-containing protein [Orrella sp. JC864]|uniref:prepilin-type N-terminal cleavage/methylation domain-containing protein n=1 Tax=Orrella sp. JC864 TaxID=3120298 RepID=UPI00300A0B94